MVEGFIGLMDLISERFKEKRSTRTPPQVISVLAGLGAGIYIHFLKDSLKEPTTYLEANLVIVLALSDLF